MEPPFQHSWLQRKDRRKYGDTVAPLSSVRLGEAIFTQNGHDVGWCHQDEDHRDGSQSILRHINKTATKKELI